METRRTRSSTRASAIASIPKISPPPIAKPSTSRARTTKLSSKQTDAPKSAQPQDEVVSSTTGKPTNTSRPKKPNDFLIYMSGLKKASDDLAKRTVTAEVVKEVQRQFKITVDNAKRDTERAERKRSLPKASVTRSGLRRGAPRQTEEYTQGKFIVKGMGDVREDFAADELEYLEKEVKKIKDVRDLKFVHLKYLMKYKFYTDLKAIKDGKVKSDFHDRFMELKGRCINELRAEIRMTLFKSEQCDYINGFLQELFEANKINEEGNIKHLDISYVETVMLHELVLMIVGLIHNITDKKILLAFLESSSRLAYGISSDSEDDENDVDI